MSHTRRVNAVVASMRKVSDQAQAEGAAQHHEPRQDLAEGEVEPAAVGTEHVGPADPHPLRRDRCGAADEPSMTIARGMPSKTRSSASTTRVSGGFDRRLRDLHRRQASRPRGSSRDTDNSGSRRDVVEYHRAGSYHRIIADVHGAEDDRARVYADPMSDGWVVPPSIRQPERDLLPDFAVFADRAGRDN